MPLAVCYNARMSDTYTVTYRHLVPIGPIWIVAATILLGIVLVICILWLRKSRNDDRF
jgi:hypothetical protein